MGGSVVNAHLLGTHLSYDEQCSFNLADIANYAVKMPI